MRTLYVRIIIVTMTIMLASAVIGFIGANIYYHYQLKPKNDAKVTQIAKDTVAIFKNNSDQHINSYLNVLTDLGYQFHIVDKKGQAEQFGPAFKSDTLPTDAVDYVISGGTYHGIGDYPWKLFVTGFFSNELKNTIGVPIQIDGEIKALFVRPNTTQQFGEMRFLLAVLLIFTLLLSFLLVLMSTRFIVNPIKRLTEATKKIANGNYHLKLKLNRRDEIGRLAADFTKMSDSLEKIEEKRQEFVSNVSHEIQSPLTSIQGFSQALREDDLPKEVRDRYLTIIEKESKRLSGLGKQLLTLAFLDSEANPDQQLTFDIADQLRELVTATEWQWREKELTIELNLMPVIFTGDPKLLQQVWTNLLTNAIRYTEQGGVIHIQSESSKKDIQIHIQDTGIGIAEAHISQLFDRFYKIDKARTRTEDSAGLGLSIVKKIIELHKGTIVVDSKLDVGTCFTVIFLT